MYAINLTIADRGVGKGYGIFPDVTEDQRNLELRARTVLAYGYTNDLITPQVLNIGLDRLVLLDANNTSRFELTELRWPENHDINTGCIYISDTPKVPWEKQPCRAFLWVSEDVSVHEALSSYFEASLRWLEVGNAKKFIEKRFHHG